MDTSPQGSREKLVGIGGSALDVSVLSEPFPENGTPATFSCVWFQSVMLSDVVCTLFLGNIIGPLGLLPGTDKYSFVTGELRIVHN